MSAGSPFLPKPKMTFGKMPEVDPHGLKPSDPGAKLDAAKIRAGLVGMGFARALEQVAHVGTFGANKYSDNGWVSVPNAIPRYTDALWRHLLAEGRGETVDADSKLLHAAHLAWNALARLDLMLRDLEKERLGLDVHHVATEGETD